MVEQGTALRLVPEMAGTLMTPEEFDSADADRDDPHVYEVVRGRLIVTPHRDERERNPNGDLGYLLWRYQEEHPECRHLDLTLPDDYVRTPFSRRRVDRAIWAGFGRIPDPKRDVPTIAVEFVSRGRSDRERDYIEKREEYGEVGVRESWIVDRFTRPLTVVRGDLANPETVVVREGETYETPLLPGFVLPLDRLLQAADVFDADA